MDSKKVTIDLEEFLKLEDTYNRYINEGWVHYNDLQSKVEEKVNSQLTNHLLLGAVLGIITGVLSCFIYIKYL